MKKIILLSGLFLFQLAHADNVIYKCTSSTGEVTYQNNMGDKTECTKTNFASFPNINFFKTDNVKKSSSVSTSNAVNYSPEKNTNISEEQRIRDAKRALILTQELNQEKEQLNTVSSMLKNLKDSNSKDSTQISQLEELKTSHVNNITAIERELGTAKNVIKTPELKIEKANLEPNLNNHTMMVTKALTPNANILPTSLPDSPSVSAPIKKETISVPKKEVIKAKNVPEVKSSEKFSAVVTAQTTPSDKRKSNSLGNSVIYSSGLSGMSKLKN